MFMLTRVSPGSGTVAAPSSPAFLNSIMEGIPRTSGGAAEVRATADCDLHLLVDSPTS